jgi:hypothetical protein
VPHLLGSLPKLSATILAGKWLRARVDSLVLIHVTLLGKTLWTIAEMNEEKIEGIAIYFPFNSLALIGPIIHVDSVVLLKSPARLETFPTLGAFMDPWERKKMGGFEFGN